MRKSLSSVAGMLVLAAGLQGQQSQGQPAAQQAQGQPPPLQIYQIDIDPTGSVYALSKPKLEGDVYVYTAWPERQVVRLPKSRVKKITRRTKDLNKEFVYQIDLVPSGRVLTNERPTIQEGSYVFHAVKNGTLMSLRQEDVKKVTRLTGLPAFKAKQEELGVTPIGNLSMQGGSEYVIPDPGSAPSSDGNSGVTCTFSNPSYSGNCTVTGTVAQGGSGNTACQDVLGCLNNTQCSQTYCNATQIRGGWTLVSVQENPPNN